ncbi:iron-sulfur cluster assembly factor IBA57, mitochondrial [Arctopsyche grandis]|uniref:iron-sulfur cluster assembly factor IBA57, mitochondrial n=1 Tax=Arctopsyche grandis TaxID=121162 RepID=UPI00406D7043
MCRLVLLSGIGRALLRARGPATYSLLQSVATNDLQHLQNEHKSLYSLLLNARGRTLFDTLIYKTLEPDTLLIDCDKTLASAVQKHLNMYKLKKDVQIEPVDLDVWVLFNDSLDHDSSANNIDSFTKLIESNPNVYMDPRLNLLGARLILPKSTSTDKIVKDLNLSNVSTTTDAEVYRSYRYRLGVSEGAQDIPFGNSFPLEANCDYLHGVSFHKGCYIGQELTARTHHTGVVRKRLMPLVFDEDVTGKIPNDSPIYSSNNSDVAVGKVRGVSKNTGIGLLRITEALTAPSLKVLGFNAKTYKPKWWPIEASKEKPTN